METPVDVPLTNSHSIIGDRDERRLAEAALHRCAPLSPREEPTPRCARPGMGTRPSTI